MERIVVGVDGSERSTLALGWAVTFARLHAAEVEVVTVARPDVLVDPMWMALPPAIDLDLEAKRTQTEALEAVDVSGVELRLFRPLGSPARCLLDQADGADLLVVGSRGLGTFGRRILGSVSHQVVTHATCPVAVIPDRAPPVNRILVGVDGSPMSVHALRWAWSEAQLRKADVEVVAAFQWPAGATGSPFVPALPVIEYDEMQVRLRAKLLVAVETVTGGGDAVVKTLVQGAPGERLLDRAEDADLLVVGSRGFGGFKGLLLGSVSQRCLTHAPCPVVIIPGG